MKAVNIWEMFRGSEVDSETTNSKCVYVIAHVSGQNMPVKTKLQNEQLGTKSNKSKYVRII